MAITNRFEISKLSRNHSHSMDYPHSHSYCELFFLISGECHLHYEDTVYDMKPGTLIFIPAGSQHQTIYGNGMTSTRAYIEFTENYISVLEKQFGKNALRDKIFGRAIHMPEFAANEICGLLDMIIDENTKNDEYSSYLVKTYFEQLVIYVMRNHAHFNSISYDQLKIKDESIMQAISYITNNYASHITLSDVAGILHLNSTYFSKKFKLATGYGFKEYLTNIRIINSEKLLLETSLSITDIAFKCGFENSNYYGDAFKKKNGISPTGFRKINGDI